MDRIRKSTKGYRWICNAEFNVEYFISPDSIDHGLVEIGKFSYGRLPSHKPPKKVKGCKRYHEPKTYLYRRPDNSYLKVSEEIFHLKKEVFREKGYKLCRKSPYSILDDPSIILTTSEREYLEMKRKEFHQKKSEFASQRRWVYFLGNPQLVNEKLARNMLELGYKKGRKKKTYSGEIVPAFHRRKKIDGVFVSA